MTDNTITQWNRLESRPRKEDFSRTMRAEIRDPLWMMTRQWQLGELTGEDAGSPVSAKVFYCNSMLDKLKLGNTDVVELNGDLPLETIVERENLQVSGQFDNNFINDVSLSNGFRRRIVNLIKDTFAIQLENKILKELNKHSDLQYYLPPTNSSSLTSFNDVSLKVNRELYQMHAALKSRSFHGGKLYVSLKEGNKLSDYISGLSNANKNLLNNIGSEVVEWFDKLFNQTSLGENNAWDPNHLEYQYATASADESNHIILKAEEYHGGRLDWYSSDVSTKVNGGEELTKDLRKELSSLGMDEVFPAEVEFMGMPHARWWEIEDSQLNFSQIQPNKTDLAKLLFAEFGLLFSNEWFVMPLTLPFGSLTKIDHIEIKDTFGQIIISKNYKNYANNKNWGLFELSNLDVNDSLTSFYLNIPPVVHDLQIGEPLERVNFIRDEMANMVWAIESVIQDGMGQGLDGNGFATQIHEYYNNLSSSGSRKINNEAKIEYSLITQVPENWIPFIPVKINTSTLLSQQIQLQRTQLPRIIEGLPAMRIEPRTSILLNEPSPYYIIEDEITKSGTKVELHWQRTRMANGKNVIWLARKRTNGRGEALSGLSYDQITQKEN